MKKEYKLINFCEFDKYAVKSYCAIHNVSEDLNLGDITKVDEKTIEDFDMMTWGFPCTDISTAGYQKGFIDEDGNKTRSGMYYEGIRILREKRPKISIIENVKNLLSSKFENEFKVILSDLSEAGYNSYYQVLNAKDYGVPQKRERIFIVSIRKDVDNEKFNFPKQFLSDLRLKDVMLDESLIPNNYYIKEEKVMQLLHNIGYEFDLNKNVIGTCHRINNLSLHVREKVYCEENYAPTLTATMYKDAPRILRIGNVNPSGKGMNGSVYGANGIAPTITTNKGEGTKVLRVTNKGAAESITLEHSFILRKLVPQECFRLMGFEDQDYEKVKNIGISNMQMYKQTGNSIVVDTLYYMLLELYKAMPYLFDDLKLSSFFSGIGAFEKALERLYIHINKE